MDEVFIIEYDNDELYEDHKNWNSEFYFKNKEDAIDYLLKEGFLKYEYSDIEGYHTYRKYEQDEWYEYTYANIKTLKLY